MDLRRIIHTDITASAVAHLSLLALLLLFSEVHPFGEVTAETVAVDIVTPQEIAEKATAEKGFSLGLFNPDYIVRFPTAVVEIGSRVEAFAQDVIPAFRPTGSRCRGMLISASRGRTVVRARAWQLAGAVAADGGQSPPDRPPP